MWADAETAVRFTSLIQGMAETFRVQCGEALFDGYEMALDDLPIDRIEIGVRRAIRECQFMPSGAELRKLCGVQSAESRALVAWESVKACVASAGSYRSVDFDCPVINATIRTMGGWVSLCDTPSGDEFDKWARKEFERIYCELWRTGVSVEMSRPLIGISDSENHANGYAKDVRRPLRIGTGLPEEPGKLLAGPSRNVAGILESVAGRLGVDRE